MLRLMPTDHRLFPEPRRPSDELPTTPICVAVAETRLSRRSESVKRVEILSGFWAEIAYSSHRWFKKSRAPISVPAPDLLQQ